MTLKGVEVRRSRIHGRGVFAMRDLKRGARIGSYTGRRHGPGEAPGAWDDQLTYLFALSDGSMIDGAHGGNATRHINHACEPNVEAVETEGADGRLTVVIRTLRDIRAGEELFLDYALSVDGGDPSDYPCRCGFARCRGTLVDTSPA